MRRSTRSYVLAGLVLGATLMASTSAVACSLAGLPRFQAVRDGARVIFAGRVTAIGDVNGAPDPATIDVTEVFKGVVPADPFTRAFVTTGCEDDLGLFADVGDSVVIAMGYEESSGFRLDPVWVFRDDGRVRTTSVEGGGATYAQLAANLRGLPPTDGEGPQSSDLAGLVLVLASVGGACAWTLRPGRQRRSG